MDCETARKYLHLFKKDELTDSERAFLGDHLSECNECKMLSKDLEVYRKTLEEIAGQEPRLSDPGQLTDSIMSDIKSGSSGLLENSVKFLRLPVLRIAASLLILIQIGVFSYQHIYISDSIKKLSRMTLNQDLQSDDPNSLNKECIEESRKIIKDILGHGDPDFNRKAIKYSRKLSNEQIENYAVQICRYSYRLQKTSNRLKKKQLLINILNNDLNIKINPEI